MTITLEVQIACIRRELAMRKNVYPKWVANGRMKQEASDKELAAMQAVHDTLTSIAAPKPLSPELHMAKECCVAECWQELSDKDDRTSPEDYPDHCLITHGELADYMTRAWHLPDGVT